jgi:hypothetical protein
MSQEGGGSGYKSCISYRRKKFIMFPEGRDPVFIAFVQAEDEEILLRVEKASSFGPSDTRHKSTKIKVTVLLGASSFLLRR